MKEIRELYQVVHKLGTKYGSLHLGTRMKELTVLQDTFVDFRHKVEDRLDALERKLRNLSANHGISVATSSSSQGLVQVDPRQVALLAAQVESLQIKLAERITIEDQLWGTIHGLQVEVMNVKEIAAALQAKVQLLSPESSSGPGVVSQPGMGPMRDRPLLDLFGGVGQTMQTPNTGRVATAPGGEGVAGSSLSRSDAGFWPSPGAELEGGMAPVPSSPEQTFEVNVIDPWNLDNHWERPSGSGNLNDPFVASPCGKSSWKCH